ncbi:MAG: type IV pilin [Halorhabdus sp.]
MDGRAVSPMVGAVLMVALTIVIAATMGVMVAHSEIDSQPPTARFSASAMAATNTISITHEGGETIDPDALSLQIRVAGTQLDKQPPIPFFAATGFISGPTGPFNEATTDEWTAGETGSLQIASTNTPTLTAGDRVECTLSVDGTVVAAVTTTAT